MLILGHNNGITITQSAILTISKRWTYVGVNKRFRNVKYVLDQMFVTRQVMCKGMLPSVWKNQVTHKQKHIQSV